METQHEHNPFRYLGICINTGKERLMCTLQIALQGFVGPKVYVGILLFADRLLLNLVVWLVWCGLGTERVLTKSAAST